MPRPNVWRSSAETTRLWFFDALSGIPLILTLAHIRAWTIAVAFLAFLLFGILEKLGFGVRVALRRLRSAMAGPVRHGHAWWRKHQERLR